MDNIQTMAVKITEEIWPIAVACLAGGFATIPFNQVDGRYLVINEICARRFKKTGISPIITIENSWMEKDQFDSMYTFVDQELQNKFAAVRKV